MIVHFFPQFSHIFCVKYFTFQPLEAFKSASDERNLRRKTHSLLELYFKCLMSELVQFGHSTRSILMHVELTEHPALCSGGAWLQCSSLHRSAAVSPSRELMRKQPCTRWEFSPWRRRQHVFFHSSVRFWVSLHSSVQANFGLKGLECLPLLGSTVSCSATPLSLVVSWSCCINIKWQYHQGGSDESVRVGEVNYWICKPPLTLPHHLCRTACFKASH